MKKLFILLSLLLASVTASAATFWYNGVLYGTVCRSGNLFTIYPQHMAQPVGSQCPVRDVNGFIIAQGVVTHE